MPAIDSDTSENKRIARRVPEDLATERDLGLLEELYADDAVEHDPMGDHRGHTAIRESFETVLDAFPDITATVEDIVAENDRVAMRVTLRGTHDSPFMGIEPTGQTFEVGNMVFTRIEDGKIAERWVQPDMLRMLQQLGVVELPDAE